MRLMPKRVKYRKSQRQKIKGNATRCNTVAFGEFGLQSLEPGWITAQQLEAGRVSASQSLLRESKLTIRVFPHKSVSSKPIETRMGKGKGEPEFWVAVVKPGTMLYEISGINEEMARQTFNRIAHKMPIKVRLVQRRRVL
ncbi:50S ribosomal protein L16 [Candidatus Brocadia sapporoensis]|uniref:Large ribosomal subunit protein uL16 n=1 Tax=Candidatus Brocadia sapporoensis TaxID=392547 RepID=A0A1V6M1I9_9BACT|nr:50S ribosomal protein L16 [Candidatus Brocadia sapporoensis]MDG6004481.1 50S ribosomal protein L16 [Candidatus Brocadia sp.]OQD46269.1 50S ribosomal protein L16 [Candidatus Brocadia sapporoensis]GJQ24701.1 MAG: 50S ribosomal protein L16 [Candidatus Brocadia sapporoensis]